MVKNNFQDQLAQLQFESNRSATDNSLPKGRPAYQYQLLTVEQIHNDRAMINLAMQLT